MYRKKNKVGKSLLQINSVSWILSEWYENRTDCPALPHSSTFELKLEIYVWERVNMCSGNAHPFPNTFTLLFRSFLHFSRRITIRNCYSKLHVHQRSIYYGSTKAKATYQKKTNKQPEPMLYYIIRKSLKCFTIRVKNIYSCKNFSKLANKKKNGRRPIKSENNIQVRYFRIDNS